MIDSYSLDVENVEAGGRFYFSFDLKNTSRTSAISNIKITLFSSDGIFTPVSGGNTFYTEEIDPSGVEGYGIELLAKAAAEQKSYPISIQIEYEYGDGGTQNVTEQINVYVVQPIRLEFSNVYYQPDAMAGNPIYMSFYYYNKGRAPLSNLTITMEGDFILEDGEMFMGNFPAGSGDYFEAMMYPMGVGMLGGSLVFNFEDAAGLPQRRTIDISVNVMDFDGGGEKPWPPIEPPIEPPVEPGGDGGLKWYWIAAICAGGAVVLGGGTLLVVKSAQKKKNASADEWAE